MCKKLHYSVRSVVALSCIFFLLFSVHLESNAAFVPTTGSNLFDDSTGITSTITLYVSPDYDKLDIQGGSYSGSSSGTSTGLSGSYSGNVSQHSVSIPQIDINEGGSQSFRVSGSHSSTSFSGTGTLTLSGMHTYSASATAGQASESGSISIGDGSISSDESGTISMTTTHGGSCNMHVHVPYWMGNNLPDNNELDDSKYYQLLVSIDNFNSLSNQGHVSNITITDTSGKIVDYKNSVSTYSKPRYYVLGSELRTNASGYSGRGNLWGKFFYLDFDYLIESITSPQIITFNPSYSIQVYLVKDEYQTSVASNSTSDVVTHQELEKNNAKLDSLNATETDTNTTTHSIFDSISAFFSSFFTNLIGVFVPEDGFFTTWFNNLNTLLEAKLGILYYPFSVIIQFFTRCSSAFSSQSTGTDIVFPAIEFTNSATGETYTFLSAQHINLADFNIATSSSANSSLVGSSGFGSLVDIIRTFNAFVILFCLLSLLRTKLNLVLRGDNNDN